MYYNVFERKEVKIVAIVTLRLNEKEEALFRNYANLTGKRLSELFKNTLAERIEDEFDLDVYYDAFAEYTCRLRSVSTVQMRFIATSILCESPTTDTNRNTTPTIPRLPALV